MSRTNPRPSLWAGVAALLLMTACAGRPDHAVVPVPATARVLADSLTLDTTATIGVIGGIEAFRVAEHLATVVGTTPESRPPILVDGEQDATILVALDPLAAPRYGPEGYALRVSGDGVRIDAATPAGLFYGVQTFRQLLPPVTEYGAARPAPRRVPHVEIEDRPRFGWRGAMLDVARHFFEVEDVKRLIDLMALHKMNRLHLHLSDDQGWRIEVPGWPALTAIGSRTEVGGGPGGYYTTAEYQELVAYAAARFVTIVPEIDLPGHTNAALASVPELNCDGVPPPLYTGIAVGFSTVCVHAETTYRFVDDVLGHLAAITPGPWLHVGGDEVEELSADEYRAFIERVESIVRGHGKRMIGWQEVAAADLRPSTVIQHWREAGEEATAYEQQVILSPSTHIYLDIKYHDGTPIGLDWSGLNPLRDAYEWDPTALIPGLPESAVLGIESPLWTETLATVEDLEFMAFPRLAAVAELAWSPPESIDWGDFRARLARLGLRWTALGVNYYRSPDVDWRVW
ncbi:MAG: family 20 glycosylhydrolase [Longimicrobiales bacterium]|nr:family 20 glycosylhydrolase [Longimicrobiales bacterium]